MVAIENTHNKCGGRALPLEWLEQLGKTCKGLGLPIHCDGARLFNAAVSQGKEIGDLLQHVDSASLCLSKVGHRIMENVLSFKNKMSLGSRLPCGVSDCWVQSTDGKGFTHSKGSWWRHETGTQCAKKVAF